LDDADLNWLEAGLALHQAGDRQGAEQLYRKAAAARPDDPTPLYLMGLARFESGEAEGAERLLQQVTELRPAHAAARMALAAIRLWRGDSAGAAETYRTVLALSPEHAGAHLGLSQALEAAGRSDEALAAAGEAVLRSPKDPAPHMARAASLTSLGRLQAAAEACRDALAAAPDASLAQLTLALTLAQLEDWPAALAAAERATELAPEAAEAWLALGAALRANGNAADAAPALRRAVALDSAKAAAHLTLGLALIDLEALDEAEACLKEALALAPDSKQAHANLSSVYALCGKPHDAIAHARRALELDPGMVTAHENLAAMLAKAGDAEGARAHRDEAFGRRNLIVITAARPRQSVLILNTTESGNVPDRHLIPPARYSRLIWFIEYATDEQMSALPPFDVVFNAIGDPDLAGPTIAKTLAFMQLCRKPILNDPRRIALTGRDAIAGLLTGLTDVEVPKTERLTAGADTLRKAAAGAGVVPPFLTRPTGAHGGDGLRLLTAEDPIALDEACAGPTYVTGFHDYRSADGLYRKYRAIFVDRRPHPYHLGISPDWMIHYERVGMRHHPDRLAEEVRFLEDPAGAIGERAWEAVAAIGRRLDLDYAGADFTVLPDGRVLLFEANATMLVHPEAADGPLAHKNPFVERILGAFQDLLAR
jgi:tetratricopeptide (TPR) repeat protein